MKIDREEGCCKRVIVIEAARERLLIKGARDDK